MNDFLTLAKARYSCRRLKGGEIPEELLIRILEAGRCAPTAHNNQPFKIWVIRWQEALAAVKACAPFPFVEAVDCVLAVGTLPALGWVRPFDGKNFADVDGSIVTTQMMLAIQDLGLATTWVGHFEADKLKAAIPEMIPYNLIALLPLGWPAEEAKPSRLHEDRKAAEETVAYL